MVGTSFSFCRLDVRDMKSLLDDLGERCHEDVSRMLDELIKRTIDGARTSTDEEDYAKYRLMLNEEYGDSIYLIIMRAKRNKGSKK
jgi:hypothetical protein